MGWRQSFKNALVLRLFDRAFTEIEAWIERELREEDGMAKETKLPDGSVVKEWTSAEIRAAMKPDEKKEPCGVCTGCGCPSRCEEAPEEAEEPHECNAACEALLPHPDLSPPGEEIGPSLRMALKNRAEIETREAARKASKPVALSIPTWEDYNAVQYRATLAETQRDKARAEVESIRKDRDELQAAKNALAEKLRTVNGSVEDRLAHLERFPHQQVLDRLRYLDAFVTDVMAGRYK